MPYADAERNMRLFAAEVMPELQRLQAEPMKAAAKPPAPAHL